MKNMQYEIKRVSAYNLKPYIGENVSWIINREIYVPEGGIFAILDQGVLSVFRRMSFE